MAVLEAAIPDHLRLERSVPAKLPDKYEPPVAAYVARFPKDAKEVVMVVLGSQHHTGSDGRDIALQKLLGYVRADLDSYRPFYWEPAAYTDNSGAYNQVVIAYWATRQLYQQWSRQSGFDGLWQGLDAASEEHGWFLEVFLPSIDRFETIFSSDQQPEGSAHMASGMSGPVQEHVYWGSMRDRLPASQIDKLTGIPPQPNGDNNASTGTKRRIRMPPRQNLAIIRSGQDWSHTSPHERKLYLETMHPVLIKGMNFLRDHGEEVGCFSCRFMDVLDRDTLQAGEATDKTFGFAFFDDLASLEGWSKSHKTHLDIFGRFMQYAGELQGQVSLRLFHEVLVLTSEQQHFEYVNCHDRTGMLASR